MESRFNSKWEDAGIIRVSDVPQLADCIRPYNRYSMTINIADK